MKQYRERMSALAAAPSFSTLFAMLSQHGERVAAVWVDQGQTQRETYGQFTQRVVSCAQAVRETLGPGDEWIGLALPAQQDWPVIFWGLLMAGKRPLLLDDAAEDAQIRHLLCQAGATILVSGRKRDIAVRQILPGVLLKPRTAQPFEPTWAEEAALCTSGTTATSRVFVYSGAALSQQMITLPQMAGDNPSIFSDTPIRSLCFLPMNHVFGLIFNVIFTSFMGYEQVYLPNRAPQTIQDMCKRFHIQMIATVPLLVSSLSATLTKRVSQSSLPKRAVFSTLKGISLSLQAVAPRMGLWMARHVWMASVTRQMLGSDLRVLIVGGSHAQASHLRTISALGYEICLGYGMTELAIVSVETSSLLRYRLNGSVGRTSDMMRARVVPLEGTQDKRGELQVYCKAMHTGRLIDGKMLPPDVDGEGFFHTGDIASIDESGRLYLAARLKEVIIRENGENVYPDEIEDAFQGLPDVDQSCVLGLASGSNAMEEEITLVLATGARSQDPALQAHLAQLVVQRNAKLASPKRVTRAYMTPGPLPMVATMKVKRQPLRAMCMQHTIPLYPLDLTAAQTQLQRGKQQATRPSEDAEHTRVLDCVRKAFADALGVDASKIGDTDHFVNDLGGDSLQSLGIVIALEEEFKIDIPSEEYAGCMNVRDVAALIEARLHGDTRAQQAQDTTPVVPITRYEDSHEYKALQARLASMTDGRNPYFVCHESALLDTSLMNGHPVLNFGSYNYVGMSGRAEVKEAAKAAIDKYGTSASGSRLLAGEKSLYQELEREIADWKHAEDALVLVSGHATNVTIVGNFCGPRDLIVYDILSHNSIEQGCRLSPATTKAFPHNDTQALERIIAAQRSRFEKILIIIEGAYSMDGDIAPVPEIVRIKKQYGCFLLVDEAHSACVIGDTGGGVDEYFHLDPTDIDIKMGTLSKGLGACGGYIAGSTALIETMRYGAPGFVFSVGISPPLAGAVLASIRLLRSDPSIVQRLHRNIDVFIAEAHKRNLNTCLAAHTAVVPILVGRDEDAFRLSNLLADKGVFVPPAVYPAVPHDKARLRYCVISEHKPEQIAEALDILVETAKAAGIVLPPMEKAGNS